MQVYVITKRKTMILKHIGSGKNPKEIEHLKEEARNWIEIETNIKGLSFQKKFDQKPHFDLLRLSFDFCFFRA